MSFIPEIILREVVARGIAVIREDDKIIPELLATEEVFYPGLTQRFKTYLKKHPKIPVVLNYPDRDLSVPNVAIISLKSQESMKESFIGDQAGYYNVFAPPDHPAGVYDASQDMNIVAVSEVVGTFDDANYHAVVTTQDDVLTCVLTAALRIAIYFAKIRLEKDYGFQALRLSEFDFKYPKDYWPKQTWSKTIQVQGLVTKEMSAESFSNTEDAAAWNAIVPKISSAYLTLSPTSSNSLIKR
tara:strand:- start:74 stop:799 length:726 start_codon:yes stop_codon:yes gene_type:complete